MVARWRTAADLARRVPRHAVWEITLSCNLKCRHCGSRAGAPRDDELTTDEAVALVDSLAAAGVREITLIGGEAYLRPDWLDIVAAMRRHDIYCDIQTGGRALTLAKLVAARDAGLDGLGVSLDGTKQVHDEIRGVPGSFEHALAALRNARAIGLATSVNSQINALSYPVLTALVDLLLNEGVTHWQPMLTVPMGNAADNVRLLLQPHVLLQVIPDLAAQIVRAKARGMTITASNTIGYFGPHEHLMRGLGHAERHWSGCEAAATGIGIEADGTIKGCPSLETHKFSLGHVRERAFADIWQDGTPVRERKLKSEPGAKNFCGTCYYKSTCISGCTWHADSLTGDGRNNPFCHYRALRLDAHGLRERIVKVAEAEQRPFAVGRFAVICETADGAPVSDAAWDALERDEAAKGGAGGDMVLCPACSQFLYEDHADCPHCGTALPDGERENQLGSLNALRAMDFLRDKLGELGIPLAHDLEDAVDA